MSNIYLSGEYTKNNASYHVEDSKYKWNNFKKIIIKNKININSFKNIVEVGCGAGQIISNSKESGLFNNCNFFGYDINPDAIDIAKKNNKSINFINKDFFNSDLFGKTDLLICADVFEHIENSYEFLKKLSNASEYLLFNIPIDISLLSLLRQETIFSNFYKTLGHLHFYSKKTALLKLEHSGIQVIDNSYAKFRLSHFPKGSLTVKRVLSIVPQKIIDLINEDLACVLMGGYSLVVLAKKKLK
jgi:SAM-dependent methyltransferase